VSRSALDQALGHQSAGERSEGLLGLERSCGERAGCRPGRAADRPEGIPLGQRCPDSREAALKRPVLAVLDLLDCSSKYLQLTNMGRA
jgi:hypothetical protein